MRVRIISEDGIGYNTRVTLEDGTPVNWIRKISLHCDAKGIWIANAEMTRPKIDIIANLEKSKSSDILKKNYCIKHKTRRESKRQKNYKYLQIMW